MQKAQSQKQYFEDLKKGIEDKRRNQYFEKMMHDNDTNIMQNKKQETDFIQKGLVERQKEEKLMLGQIYQNQIEQAKKLKEGEKQMEKELERMQIEKIKGVDPDAYNKLKKQAYQQELRQEIEQKNKLKQYDEIMREQSVREARKMMDEYARREVMNEQDYKNKFSKFDQNLQKRLNDYNNYVMRPNIEKQYAQDSIEKKNIEEHNRRQAEEEQRQEQLRKNQLKNASNVIREQMSEKNRMKKLNSELGQIENQRTSDRAMELSTFDQMIKEDKKNRQDMYRQMLNSQIQYNQGLKAFGNMTHVEKKMNKEDLKAYKKFDNNQYALIPGISNERKFMQREGAKSHKKVPYEEEQRRLEAYGYGRYLKKVPTVGPIENYNIGMSQSRQNSKGFGSRNRSYTGGNYPSHPKNHGRENSGVPHSRRAQISPRCQAPTALRNAGHISVSYDRGDQRAAGSPSGVNHPYRQQHL